MPGPGGETEQVAGIELHLAKLHMLGQRADIRIDAGLIHGVLERPRLGRLHGESPALAAGDLDACGNPLVVMRGQARTVWRDVTIGAHETVEIELRADGLRPLAKHGIGQVDIGNADRRARVEQVGDLVMVCVDHAPRTSGLLTTRKGRFYVVAGTGQRLSARKRLPQSRPTENMVEFSGMSFDAHRRAREK